MSIKKIIREALENVSCETCKYEHNLTRCEYCQFQYTTIKYKAKEKHIKDIIRKIGGEQCLKKKNETTSEDTSTKTVKDTNS